MLAEELRLANISVTELIPGRVKTALTAREPDSAPLAVSEWVKSPADVVPVAVFLAEQPDSGHVILDHAVAAA